jgi:hypothetical protein
MDAAAWLSCVPCEKLSRAASIPPAISRSNWASEWLAGPMVQTILALRMEVLASMGGDVSA